MTSPDQGPFANSGSPLNQFAAHNLQAALTAKQIEEWREHINNCHHPIVVFDANSKPILLNQAIREYLSEPTPIEQPAAFVWQEVCEMAGRFVAEAAKSPGFEICDAFPVQNKCFTLIGSILRTANGRFLGAVVNIADMTDSGPRLRSMIGGPSGLGAAVDTSGDEGYEQYQDWVTRRDQSRQKMSRLSRRENQVVGLVSEGLPNKSIARELDISVKTIEKHRANATRKLGVGSTPEMVRIAVTADNRSPGQSTSDSASS